MFARLKAYWRRAADHPDPLASVSARTGLVVLSSQPTYPLYVGWLADGAFLHGSATFATTPLFLSALYALEHRPLLGRLLLIVAGAANTFVCATFLGTAAGVELFLLPCLLLTLLHWRRAEWPVALMALGTTAAVLPLAEFAGTRLGGYRLDADASAQLYGFHASGALILMVMLGAWLWAARRKVSAISA